MGLLDEAIREHLDLKRKRGADPGEVAREETDALGPAVRTAPPEEEAAAADDAAVEAPVAEAEVEAPPPADAEAPPAPPAEEFVEPHPVEEHAVPPPAEAAQRSDETAAFDAEELFADEDAAQVEEPGPQPGERAGEAAPDPAGEDVLEETPDFLQETPEHDRLWFEQKPPKDFDFDG
jgi:hypothetical protein